MRLEYLIAVGFCFLPTLTWGEGLIYQLPPDGHWASYTIDDTIVESDGKTKQVTGKLTVSSVGTEKIEGKTCRWIEIALMFEIDGKQVNSVDKLLLPEESLQKGQEPLKHIYKLHRQYGEDKEDILKIEDREELQQFSEKANSALGIFLHGPYEKPKPLDKELIDSKLGQRECAGIRAKETTKQRDISVDAEYTIRLHPDAPFGVVQWKAVRKTARDGRPGSTMNQNLTLSGFGTGAKSALTDEE